ncbi:MAG: response regulator transcription factor [Lachnospiraceae bacterium]|nr:response regulator transcription factor [Lachnospiraceae bacterium]
MAKILVVDDDAGILMLIRKTLEKDGHQVTCCEGISDIVTGSLIQYDLILLDVMMPGTDGFTYCRQIRGQVDCPILFLTAKTMDADLIEGFSIGADDYIKKPFSIHELRARVGAHIRRENREYHTRLTSGGIRFEVAAKKVYCEEEEIRLTKKEYEICEFLVRNKGQVFSLEQIIEQVFGYDSESDTSAIREHIKNIRAKFAKCKSNPIQTVWGIGYKWS